MLAKRHDGRFGIKFEDFFDFFFVDVFIAIICARIYYVLFNLDYYLAHISEIIMINRGGLAIYGGIIGSVVYAIIFFKKKKILTQ